MQEVLIHELEIFFTGWQVTDPLVPRDLALGNGRKERQKMRCSWQMRVKLKLSLKSVQKETETSTDKVRTTPDTPEFLHKGNV